MLLVIANSIEISFFHIGCRALHTRQAHELLLQNTQHQLMLYHIMFYIIGKKVIASSRPHFSLTIFVT